MELAIIQSDNIAKNMLLRLWVLSAAGVLAVFAGFGVARYLSRPLERLDRAAN